MSDALSAVLPKDTLTDREHTVLRLIRQGYSNLEIGSELSLSVNTIKAIIRRIMDKVGLDNRVELAVWYQEKA
jgi:DNA-binding NarL/FixJ family response regulator